MSDWYTQKQDKIDFKQIALGHYKKILDISTNEFTGGYWNYIQMGNSTNKQYVTDKRKEYIQSVEMLALALVPYFDEQMKIAWGKHEERQKLLEDKYLDQDGIVKDNRRVVYSVQLLNLVKDLFKELSCLIHRLDYFKAKIYEEGLEDWDEEEEDQIVDIDK